MCSSILERLINKVMELKEFEKIKSELEWYRTYGQFINANYSSVDAEACAYADGDDDMDGYNNQEK